METGTYRRSPRMCIVRPAIGCIVEGEGERVSFKKLIYGINGTIVKPIHISKAQGNGDITSNLEEKLTDLAETHMPITIIVCLDYIDAKKNNPIIKTCEDLIKELSQRATNWLKSKRIKESQKPKQISIVTIIPKLECWYFADSTYIKSKCEVDISTISFPKKIINADADIRCPQKLIKILFPSKKIKSPKFAKEILTSGDPSVMRENSRSFRKFFDEVESAKVRHDSYLKLNFG